MEKQIECLRKITDDFGVIQFSNKNQPDIKSGYTLDDNTRALIVSSKSGLEKLSEIYFNFIKNAQTENGRFVNFYSEKRKPLEIFGSEDSFGRTLWALGEYFNKTEKGEKMIFSSLNALDKFGIHYPISESFAILGLTKIYDAGFERKKTKRLIDKLSGSLIEKINSDLDFDKNWFWVSDEMTYENARIPQALLRAYKSVGYYFHFAKNLTNFLDETVFEKDKEGKTFLNVVGNNTIGLKGTWYKKGFAKPKFDEQPVDVGGMIELHSEAYSVTERNFDLEKAKISLEWFTGRNRLNKKMISPKGGIYDGLNKDYVNPNQGAESLIAYMMAKIKFDEIFGKDLYTLSCEEIEQNKINKNGDKT